MSWKFLAWLDMSKYTGEVVTASAFWDDYFFQSALAQHLHFGMIIFFKVPNYNI